jgi:predicted metal-dependent phosphoesterase TrpH
MVKEMPAHEPFTFLCQQLARGPRAGRADLHTHSTASDGEYSPTQIVELARRAGLAAVALTDHDTLAGLSEARAAAAGTGLEVIAATEITCEFQQRELHLLAYFIDPHEPRLAAALASIRDSRTERFRIMVERLRSCGVSVDEKGLEATPHSLGRRHLAQLLVQQGQVGSIREAFARFLADGGVAVVPKKRLDVAEAIALVRSACGVAAWAHPVYDATYDQLSELAGLGLQAVEIDSPDSRRSRRDDWRRWVTALGLAVTAGSDCHGPGRRTVGASTISDIELERLRQLTRGSSCSALSSTSSSKD